MRSVRCIVVAFHGEQQLDRCLAEITQTTEVTVIDNSSSASVREIAAARGARYRDSGANLGFAAGVNVGLREILKESPSDVLLLNPDALLEPGACDKLAECLHRAANNRVAAVAPALRSADGHDQRVAWPFPSPLRAWLEAFGLGRVPSRRRFVIGAVVLLRWEALKEVGLFDERFFLYAEEADWQRRAAHLNWTSELCSYVAAEHVGAGTSDDPKRREILFHAGQETYIRKWYGRSGWFVYRVAACTGAAARAGVLAGDRRSEAARRAWLYARGPRRCAALAGR